MRQIPLPDGTLVPALGQGTWKMGEAGRDGEEVAALRLGIELGQTLIDTAEMYGDGAAEELVGQAIAGQRDRVFLVSKVFPHNAGEKSAVLAVENTLKRVKTDRLDLYLLHWRGGIPLAETVAAFDRMIRDGKILRWGVSNFDTDDMAELDALPGCAVNQVLYSPEHRGIEFDLLPWQAARKIPVMAYSPVGQGGRLLRNPAMARVAASHRVSTAQVAIAWGLRQPGVISIPKASTAAHVRENAAAIDLTLTAEDLAEIDAAFPPPRRKQHLAML
jgi:diketogulonate reductase-like aldo/keto reductase